MHHNKSLAGKEAQDNKISEVTLSCLGSPLAREIFFLFNSCGGFGVSPDFVSVSIIVHDTGVGRVKNISTSILSVPIHECQLHF